MRLSCHHVDRITQRSYSRSIAVRRLRPCREIDVTTYAPAVGALRSRLRTVRAGVTENLAARRFWSAIPENRFTTDGFEVVERVEHGRAAGVTGAG